MSFVRRVISSIPRSRHASGILSGRLASSQDQQRRTLLTAVKSMSEIQDEAAKADPSQLIIIQWKATWCGKCKVVATELEALESKRPDLIVLYADVDTGDLVTGKKDAGVDTLPVTHFVKGGELVHTINGVKVNELRSTIDKFAPDRAAATDTTAKTTNETINANLHERGP